MSRIDPHYTRPQVDALVEAEAERAADAETALDGRLDVLEFPVLTPEQFGAVGDGTTDDTAAFAAAQTYMAGSTRPRRLVLTRDYKVGRVPLNLANLTIVGEGGIIRDGGFDIGLYGGGSYAHLDITIRNVRFVRETPSITVDAITAQWAYGIDVVGCSVDGYRAVFGVVDQPTEQNHHVARVRISGLRTRDCQFVFRCTHLPSESGNGVADVTITECPELAVLDTHIYAEGIDGLMVDSVTMFMPGYVDGSTTKRWNIYVDHGAEISIGQVQAFEAGLEGIWLRRVHRWTIGAAHVSYPGQRVRSSGIRISDGGEEGDEHSYGSISGPVVFFPSLHGIKVEGNTGHVAIDGAVVRSPGSSDRYYGAEGVLPADFVNAASTTKAIKMSGGEFSGGTNARVALAGTQSESGSGAFTLPIDIFGKTFNSDNWGTFEVGPYLLGARRRSTGAVNAFLQWYVNLQPGIWQVTLLHYKSPDAGIYTVAVDGIDRGTLDGYAAAGAIAVEGVTTISIPVGGRVLVTVQMKTKNASSSAYYGNLSGLSLTRTAQFTS